MNARLTQQRSLHRERRRPHAQHGATLVEAMIVFPIFIFTVLAMLQAAMVYFAKSNVNYAAFEAARSGSVNGASIASINLGFEKAMVPYYGGGRSLSELTKTLTDVVQKDLTEAVVRIEILSPTQESFLDYNSPRLQAALNTGNAVIPNVGLDELTCPRDVPSCNSDPKTNKSGQTLLDANLLKLRITYGIPPAKQMPMVGKFYTWALDKLNTGANDPFMLALIKAGRIPVVTSTVIRMQSDAIKNTAMASSPGPGNDGKPVDPGTPPPTGTLPTCPWWDPSCASCPDGTKDPKCMPPPDTCPGNP